MPTTIDTESPARGPISPDDPLLFSVSSLARINRCEKQYILNLRTHRDPAGPAAWLGTLVHQLVQAHTVGLDWRETWGDILASANPEWSAEWDPPEMFSHAGWLMERYVSHYSPDPFRLQEPEADFSLPVPGIENVILRGYVDGLGVRGLAHTPALLEIKTMGQWGKFERAEWEPQVHTYIGAMSQRLEEKVSGCLFRAIGTRHKWNAKTPAPVNDSFREVWIPYDQDKIDAVLEDYRRAARRAMHILEHEEDIRRCVGEHCTYCAFKVGCVLPDTLADGGF